MKLTKYAHACVVVEAGGSRILLDPGTFTPEAAELLKTADVLLITHDHFDHVDEKVVRQALTARPELPVYAPAPVVELLGGSTGSSVRTAQDGMTFEVGPLSVSVRTTAHAPIHADVPRTDNATYLITEGDTGVFHPGDSYLVPGVAVDTLLVPTSGPWTKLGEAVDFVRAVAPRQAIQIHEVMLSETGQSSTAQFLGQNGLTKVPFTVLPVGESVQIPDAANPA